MSTVTPQTTPINTHATRYDYILRLCSGGRQFSTPFTIGDKVYATNSFLVVRMLKDFVRQAYEEGKAEIEEVYEKEKVTSVEKFEVDVHNLLGLLSQYSVYVDAYKTCVDCHGTGNTECDHCGNETYCECCDGTGSTGDADPLRTVRFAEKKIELNGVPFTPAYIHIVALVALVVGRQTVTFEVRNTKAHIDMGEIEMLMMTQTR